MIRGVVPAALLGITAICGGFLAIPTSALPRDDSGARLVWAIQWALLPILALMFSIMRVANHRFSTPEDIDGSGLTRGTPRVLVLRAILQNTLEQAMLALAAYMIWATAMPHAWLRAVPIAASLFAAGRILFAIGYERGAPGRAMGFGLTAYPTFAMLVAAAIWIVLRSAGWVVL